MARFFTSLGEGFPLLVRAIWRAGMVRVVAEGPGAGGKTTVLVPRESVVAELASRCEEKDLSREEKCLLVNTLGSQWEIALSVDDSSSIRCISEKEAVKGVRVEVYDADEGKQYFRLKPGVDQMSLYLELE